MSHTVTLHVSHTVTLKSLLRILDTEGMDLASTADSGPPAKKVKLPSGMPASYTTWASTRSWLTYRLGEDGSLPKLFCKVCCQRYDKTMLPGGHNRGAWSTRGCTRLKLDAVKEHEESWLHKQAIGHSKQAARVAESGGIQGMQIQHIRNKNKQQDAAMLKCLQALYWIAKEDIALRKWHSLKELLGQVGVDLSAIRLGKNAHYDSDQILGEFLEALAEVVHDETSSLIQRSAFVGVMADETTDVSNICQLDLHLRIVCDGVVRSRFGTFQPVPNTTAYTLTNAICEWCEDRGVNLRRLHFGTDGASNFTGRHSGVASRMKAVNPHLVHVHCVCHREALAVSDACKDVPYLNNVFQPTLGGVFRFFHNSPVREAALHAVQVLFDKTETYLKEPKFVRWLSHEAAVKAFVNCFPALIVALSREASERKDAAAKAYLAHISKVEFVASLLMLQDLLPHLTRLSKVFQKSSFNFSDLQPALDVAMASVEQLRIMPGSNEQQLEQFLESANLTIRDLDLKRRRWRETVRNTYFDKLEQGLRDRFPAMPLLAALSIFDPVAIIEMSMSDVSSFGNDHLEVLLNLLGQPHQVSVDGVKEIVRPLVDSADTRVEWVHAKSVIRADTRFHQCKASAELIATLHRHYSWDLPNLLSVADWGLAIPLSTADSERDFSKLKIIKNARRNRLQYATLNRLMQISVDGPPAAEFPFQTALWKWHGKKTRRVPSKSYTPVSVPAASQHSVTKSCSSSSMLVPISATTGSPAPSPLGEILTDPLPPGSTSSAVPTVSSLVPTSSPVTLAKQKTIKTFFSSVASSEQSPSPLLLKENKQHRTLPTSITVSAAVPAASVPCSTIPSDVTDEQFGRQVVLLPRHQCQSRIDGRNGSNACTIICALFCKELISTESALCGNCSHLQSMMCNCMMEGNKMYDRLGLTGMYSCSEVVNLKPAIGVSICQDFFITPEQCHEIFDNLQSQAECNVNGRSAGVLVIHPFSFAVAVDRGLTVFFDSHSHGENGALLAIVSFADSKAYFEKFLNTYYAFLKYDGSVRGKYAQLSILCL